MTLRTCLALAAAWLLFFAGLDRSSETRAADSAAESFPFFAYIAGTDVHLRSGPGMQYYPTEKLSQGVELEVYRQDPGGWLAVRPTERSFSWVLARYVRLAGENQGIIVGDGVVARTGSSLSDVRDVIQVQLNYGEPVTIVGVREFGEGRARESWVQIAPPAGEFRWVSERDVRRAPASVAQAAKPRAAAPSRATREQPTEREAIAEVGYEPEEADSPATRPSAEREEVAATGGWKTSSGPPPKKKPREPVVQADFHEAERDAEAERAPRERNSEAEPTDEPRRERKPSSKGKSFDDSLAEDVAPQRRLKRDAQADEADRLVALQTDVAREAAREPEEWDFNDLAHEAQDLSERAEQGYVRKRAVELLEQIERFESLRDRGAKLGADSPSRNDSAANDDRQTSDENTRPRRSNEGVRQASYEEPADEPIYPVKAARYDDAPITEPGPRLPNASRTAPRSTPAASPPTESADDPRFDAVGVLTPIVATKVGDPTYALLDARGEVAAFVAPAPGVSLRKCVGEKIGVVGSTSPTPLLGGKTLVVVRRAAQLAQ